MKIKNKKTISKLIATVMTICTLSSVCANAVVNPIIISRTYGSHSAEGYLCRYPESYVLARTTNSARVSCQVSLSVEYYLKENPNIKKTWSDGKGDYNTVSVKCNIPSGYYCNKAESHHICVCSYFNFDERLSNP